MSTGRRLAKRSIIGTKVCAPGPDGLWYSGVIQDVKTPPTATVTSSAANANGTLNVLAPLSPPPPPPPPPTFIAPGDTQLNADTRYIVRFDFKTQAMQPPAQPLPLSLPLLSSSSSSLTTSTPSQSSDTSVIVEARRAAVAVAAAAASVHLSPVQALRRNAMIKEFRESDLIGPGFRSIMGIQLQPGQRVFLTYNGREQSGDVVHHDAHKDEVLVKITTVGNEEPIELKKRLEEVRLLESRRSARLADQDRDTDFARLADMGGDRRRTTHSIEVPLTLTSQHNSRKRPPSDAHDCSSDPCNKDEMNACNAALILMNLSNNNQQVAPDKWLGSSPGSSSSAWSSGSASPPLSDDGHALHGQHILSPHDAASANARIRTTSVSTSDEGIVIDFKEDRKKKSKKFRCTFPGCSFVEQTQQKIERHVRSKHLGRRPDSYDSCSDYEHEEEFYYTEDDDDDELVKTPSPASPPTLSHRDMARPPHEDPEYIKQIKQGRAMNFQQHHSQSSLHHNSNGSRAMHYSNNNNNNNNTHITSSQQQQLQNNNTSCIPTSPLAHHNYTWPPSTAAITVTATSTPNGQHQQAHQNQQQQQLQQQQQQTPHHSVSPLGKHARPSSRPSHSAAPYPSPTFHHQHHNYSSSSGGSNSSNSSSNNSSPVIHSNSNANNVLQQLSQQNVTVTAHNAGGVGGNQPHQQQHHLSSVTITPNYHPQSQPPPPPQQQQQQQQHVRGQQQTTASNLVANSGNMPMQHVAVQHAVGTAKHTPNSPNRRTRGENKKCRKVYGMERKEQWCTQCKWKKACSRFGD